MRIKSSDEKKPGIVYIAINKVNGKRYIGITSQYLSHRKSRHFRCAEKESSQTYFHRAIRKYGRENFSFTTIRKCQTFKEANLAEIELIADLKPEYNQAKGGGGCLGWSPSDETREKMRERMLGKPSYWKGKELPESFLEGRARWNRENKEWSEYRKLGPKSSAKKVVCLDDGKVFDSTKEAARFYGVSATSISVVCSRSPKRRTVGGMVFRFFGDHHGGVTDAEKSKRAAQKSGRKLARPCYQKRVICLDDGMIFESAKEASLFYGIHYGTVSAVAKGNKCNHTAGGRRFKYLLSV